MLGLGHSLHVRSMLPHSRSVVCLSANSKDTQFYAQIAASAYNELALLHAQQSDFQGATKNFESAHQRDEAQPEVAYNLGLAQFKTGNFASAAEPLRKAETLSAASAVESRRFRCPVQTLSNARDERSVAAAMRVVGGVAS